MTLKTLQYVAKVILFTLITCQLGNAISSYSSTISQHPIHTHDGADSEDNCCIDDDDATRWLSDLDVDSYTLLPKSIQISNLAITSEQHRRLSNLVPIFPSLYLLFQSFLE